MTTALILAGAVAKGAFEAGVLSVLAREAIDVTSVVATSAGALNGALFAAGIACERLPEASDILRQLWEEKARWSQILRPSLAGTVAVRGFSSTAALQALLDDALAQIVESGPPVAPVRLQLVTTRLRGEERQNGADGATTFEHAFAFHERDFAASHDRQRISRAAVASAAFPFLFEPVDDEALGPCIDGGAVNNAPISYALDASVSRVIVVTGNPLKAPDQESLGGLDLLGQVVDIAINERLFRDLLQARKVNAKLERVEAVAAELGLNTQQREKIVAALGWKPLEVIEIRPEVPLEGNAFKAFGNGQLRRDYIELGVEAAERALAGVASRSSGIRGLGSQRVASASRAS
jgi:NTE family protein